MNRPSYFEPIRIEASKRWDHLEQDPVLAGPWHQLFKQVQSPRHVVSELLQNAEDARATEASVAIVDKEFVFTHNGGDFIEEHFASLCRFGYSNKRTLHTIGFRGIGFKSTFSLGDEVSVHTPTLAVAFRKQRFTEPVWIEGSKPPPAQTEIRVVIKDSHRHRELEKNFDEWLESPASLLFFSHIRCLRIGGQEVHWQSHGAGPVDNSEWMALSTLPERKYLLLRSQVEDFPDEALQEIRHEHMLAAEEGVMFPPCPVEIVLGLEGRLFVILPTGVKTTLPFACNAPFVQDPARVKIKDPDTSPTNRWLLHRVGKLAATAMLAWLNRPGLGIEQRCEAYNLLPDVNRHDNSLEGSCALLTAKAFEAAVREERFLLTDDGRVEPWQGCVAVPATVLDIWSTEQVTALFVKSGHPILCRHITQENCQKLTHWGCITALEKLEILDVIEEKHLPKPATCSQLLALWAYVSSDVTGYRYARDRRGVRIVPVQGENVLYAGNEVVRLGEKKLLRSPEDWQFLSKYLLVLNQNWSRYLAEQSREAKEGKTKDLGMEVEAAYDVLNTLGLNETSDVSRIVERVASMLFLQESIAIEDCVRLAQLAATLGASVSEGFQFVTRDGYRMFVSAYVIADSDGDLDVFVDEEYHNDHVLHQAYGTEFISCTKAEWEEWIATGRSGMLTFVPILPLQETLWGRPKLLALLRERDHEANPSFPYVTNDFKIEDWDFDSDMWQHWHALANQNGEFWGRLLTRILKQPQRYWSKTISSKVSQVARAGYHRQITPEPITSAWITKFRSLACLQDSWGHYHQPAELLRRTPETESLLDVEPFVRAELDTESTRPLLCALGVRDTPTGPERLLERLRALAGVVSPPIYEVEKWYHRLDQMVAKCSTQEFQTIKDDFHKHKLILTESNNWARASEVFLNASETDAPGSALVHPSVRQLALWHKIGVAGCPTPDLAIDWLKSISSGKILSQDELRRVRSLLPRYPDRIWNECGHWLNLEGEWVTVKNLSHALTMQSLIPWKHLFPAIKQRTADLQKLSYEICQRLPFSQLSSLADSIEDRLQENSHGVPDSQYKPWLHTLGSCLQRIVLDDEGETAHVRKLADRLARTVWQVSNGLETVPYIDGTPAGTPRRADVLWEGLCLYVQDRSTAKMAHAVALELAGKFGRQEINDAIKLCYEHSPEFVQEYLAENFTLISSKEACTEQYETTERSDFVQAIQTMPIGQDGEPDRLLRNSTQDLPEYKQESVPPLPPGGCEQNNSDEVSPDRDEKNLEGCVDEPTLSHPKHIKPVQPSLIQRFAHDNGYTKEGSERFYHVDGSWIERITGNSFSWERRSVSGELLQCYWVKDHCFEREPLQLGADVWGLCEKFPDKYSLIVSAPNGAPAVISGRQLREMCDQGQLTLHPATYRLVYESEPKS